MIKFIFYLLPYLLPALAFGATWYAVKKDSKLKPRVRNITVFFAIMIMIASMFIHYKDDKDKAIGMKLAESTSIGVDKINLKVANILDTLSNIEAELYDVSRKKVDSLNFIISKIEGDLVNSFQEVLKFRRLAERGNELSKVRNELLQKEFEQLKPIMSLYPSDTDTVVLNDFNGKRAIKLEFFINNIGGRTAESFSYNGIALFSKTTEISIERLEQFAVGSDIKKNGIPSYSRLRILSEDIDFERYQEYKRGYFILNCYYHDPILSKDYSQQFVIRYSATAPDTLGGFKGKIDSEVVDIINQYFDSTNQDLYKIRKQVAISDF